MNQYTSNTLIKLSVVIGDIDGVATDPTGVTMKIKTPDGTISDQSTNVVRDSTGNYHVEYLPTSSGLYTYEWIGTGSVKTAKIGRFLVSPETF